MYLSLHLFISVNCYFCIYFFFLIIIFENFIYMFISYFNIKMRGGGKFSPLADWLKSPG